MTVSPVDTANFAVVILTMGQRPADLRRAIESVLAQHDVNVDVVVVGNGWQPVDLPAGVKALHLRENLGIPAGRNAGVPMVGAVAIRRPLFAAIGGWPAEFFYAHEGIDVVWRVWDEGFVPWYAADLIVNHPVIDPARHDVYYRMNARNRVWLARRNLPVVLEPFYVGTWVGLTLARVHDRAALKAWFQGLSEGMRIKPEGRRAMKWSTVWAMTKAGRPPVI